MSSKNSNSNSNSGFPSSSSRELQIPLCKLTLANITYEPLTETYTNTNNTQKANSNANNSNVKSEARSVSLIKRKKILHNITPPPIEPYKLQAWMGPSGSGKTTLLSIASGAIEYSRDPGAFTNTNSRITLNNDPMNFLGGMDGNGNDNGNDNGNGNGNGNGVEFHFPKGLTGIVWQDDLLLSNLTVRETIEFAAKLKSSPSSNNHKIDEMVDRVLDDLSLTSVQHSLIGQSALGEGRGISGGERKRVSVAQELVTRPSLLFLDEPTSGLDASSALELMRTLKNLAQNGGHSIVTIVHQPRTTIFDLMDGLLLLSRGEEVYSGCAQGARQVLESCPVIGYDLPPMTNVADWIIDVIRKDESESYERNIEIDVNVDVDADASTYRGRYLPQHWMDTKSQHQQQQLEEGRQKQDKLRLSTLAEIKRDVPKYMTSFTTQLRLLTNRSVKQVRGDRISTATIISQVAYLLFETILWFRLPDDSNHVYERNSLLFFFIIAQANGLVTQSVPTFRRDKALVSRERSKKMYQVLPYYFAKTAAEITTSIAMPMIHIMVVYWTTNLRAGVGPFFTFVVLFYLTITNAQGIGFILSAALPSLQLALVLAPTISIFLFILAGFYVPFVNIPLFISWTTYLSFATYGYSGLLINEYRGRDIPCASDVSVSIGYSGECPVKGDDVLEALGVTGLLSKLWFNIVMLIVLQVVVRVGAYIFLRRTN